MNSAKTIIFLFLFSFSLIIPAFSAQQSFSRLFSYDPHPSTAVFPEQMPVNNTLADIEVRFYENWNSKTSPETINQIYFEVSARKNGRKLVAKNTEKININPGLQKGSNLTTLNLENLKFQADLSELKKTKSGVTDLTIKFSVTYDSADMQKAAQNLENQSAAPDLSLCRRFAKKADVLPAKNIKGKISLYKKALMVAPPASHSNLARQFRAEVNRKLKALNAPADAQSTVAKPQQHTSVKTFSQPVQTSVSKKQDPSTSNLNPRAVELFKQAKTLLAKNQGPEGRQALRQALDLEPDYYDAIVLLGDNAFENRKFVRAKEAFDQALKLNNKDADIMLKYFKACYYKGEGATAIERLQGIQRNNPNDSGINLALAESYFQLGDLPNAEELCNKVLQKNPSNYKAKNLLERINRLLH
ncbi:MAG: tetratricopeptide repeat protein [Candidatus Rifleibacteriota bacterium]